MRKSRKRINEIDAVANVPPQPAIINIENESERNNAPYTQLWSGPNLSVSLIKIAIGGETGENIHLSSDKLYLIQSGNARVLIGNDYQRLTDDDYAIMIPANTKYNIINQGNEELIILAVTAPPQNS